jgi:hypothetical protein
MGAIKNELYNRRSSVCVFCRRTIEVEFDLELHLYEQHRMELVHLRLGRGSLDSRIEYAIEQGNNIAAAIKQLNKEDRKKLGFCSDNLDGANL